jgi:hypothetical protein
VFRYCNLGNVEAPRAGLTTALTKEARSPADQGLAPTRRAVATTV